MTDVCPNDPFCDLGPGHDGECRQPFETEYRPGASCQVQWMIDLHRELLRRVAGEPLDPTKVEQKGLFG